MRLILLSIMCVISWVLLYQNYNNHRDSYCVGKMQGELEGRLHPILNYFLQCGYETKELNNVKHRFDYICNSKYCDSDKFTPVDDIEKEMGK